MAILGYSGTFLDLIHLLEGVNGSNLFLSHPNTSADVAEGLEEARHDISPPNWFKQLYSNGQNWPFWAILTYFWT